MNYPASAHQKNMLGLRKIKIRALIQIIGKIDLQAELT